MGEMKLFNTIGKYTGHPGVRPSMGTSSLLS